MRGLRTAVAAAVGAAALAVPAGAIAQISSISIGDGQLGPEGASVSVPVTVQCDPGWNLAFVGVSVAQSSGHKLAQGSGFFSENFPGVPCDSPTTATVSVSDTSPFAFKQGGAAASAEVEVFDPTTFSFVVQNVTQSIRISRKPSPYVDPLRARRGRHAAARGCGRNVCRL